MVQLYMKYKESMYIGSWLWSEKYDGMRAIWDGKGGLWSRNWKPIGAPDSWLSGLPSGVMLDGELHTWDGVQKVKSVCRKKVGIVSEWAGITYRVFAIYDWTGYNRDIEAEVLRVCKDAEFVEAVHWETMPLGGVQEKLNEIVERGGEGLVLMNPMGIYTHGRVRSVLKVKPVSEGVAVVVAVQEGLGRNAGRMGALEVSWKGIRFKIGCGFSDADRNQWNWLGKEVSFRYTGVTEGGRPKEARFVC